MLWKAAGLAFAKACLSAGCISSSRKAAGLSCADGWMLTSLGPKQDKRQSRSGLSFGRVACHLRIKQNLGTTSTGDIARYGRTQKQQAAKGLARAVQGS